MADSINYIQNRTIGLELEISCISCVGKTYHKVVSSYDLLGESNDGERRFEWWIDSQIIQCQGCKTVSFRKASYNSDDWMQSDYDGNGEFAIDETIYPSRVEGIMGLGDDAHYLPTKVRRIYDETLKALSGQSPVLAGIGLRALLETVCKEKQATEHDLFQKIDSLVSAAVLTPASAAILHKIRTLGNAAAHEVKPHSAKQLGLAMNIVEHLLKDVYILPKQADSEFGDDI